MADRGDDNLEFMMSSAREGELPIEKWMGGGIRSGGFRFRGCAAQSSLIRSISSKIGTRWILWSVTIKDDV
jgi:hypothetical protein